MATVLVPITPSENQSFDITLPVNSGNLQLSLSFTWNGEGDYWFMSVKDKSGNLLLDAIPVITGDYPDADILRQYQYLNIGSCVLMPASTVNAQNPTFDTFGSDFVLVWSDNTA